MKRLPNNNVLFNVHHVGVFEVNRSGQVVWSHLDSGASHDVDRLPNGNTLYVRGWVSKGEPHVIEVDPRGAIVWSWDGLRQFDKPPSTVFNQGWIHVNAATRLDNGNTLISLRNFNAVVEVDRAGDVVFIQEFPLQDLPPKKRLELQAHPHNPELLANGNLLVALTGANVVLEADRQTRRPAWKWEHPDGPGNIAHIRDANRLPNGHTLLVEANAISEVAPDCEIVWRLRAVPIDKRGKRLHFLYKAQRISPDGRAFGG